MQPQTNDSINFSYLHTRESGYQKTAPYPNNHLGVENINFHR